MSINEKTHEIIREYAQNDSKKTEFEKLSERELMFSLLTIENHLKAKSSADDIDNRRIAIIKYRLSELSNVEAEKIRKQYWRKEVALTVIAVILTSLLTSWLTAWFSSSVSVYLNNQDPVKVRIENEK